MCESHISYIYWNCSVLPGRLENFGKNERTIDAAACQSLNILHYSYSVPVFYPACSKKRNVRRLSLLKMFQRNKHTHTHTPNTIYFVMWNTQKLFVENMPNHLWIHTYVYILHIQYICNIFELHHLFYWEFFMCHFLFGFFSCFDFHAVENIPKLVLYLHHLSLFVSRIVFLFGKLTFHKLRKKTFFFCFCLAWQKM